ncbi:MAG: hypothetical protein CVU57_08305 [Deltaproteobacteria bacterium HGW-Deltaproteobacteria-15]|nr:MAG: hypothetical protein CVU57_08305 [Deltaproteobacteria bacterium HGW-Deltaproteobacteria-15]
MVPMTAQDSPEQCKRILLFMNREDLSHKKIKYISSRLLKNPHLPQGRRICELASGVLSKLQAFLYVVIFDPGEARERNPARSIVPNAVRDLFLG